jgi:hypothetical protein
VEAERTGIERDVGFLGLEWDPAMEIGRNCVTAAEKLTTKTSKTLPK